MIKQFYFLCSLLVVAMVSSCTKDTAENDYYGSIAGSVSDQTTGEPVATVNVTITPGGASTVTGSDGTFSFRNLYEDEYTLSIGKEGYKPNSTDIYVQVGEPTPVHLLIERIPNIVTADRDLLDFGSNASTNTLSFNIVNPGYVDLEWEIEERCDWITEIKPQKGTLKYGKTEAIVVVIDRELLPSGENEAVIVVRSSNGSSEVKVTAIGAERYAPKLNTLEATEITSSSATLNGEIIDAGVPAYSERGFVYSLNSMPTFDNMIAKLTVPITDKNKYSYVLNGLTLNETYYVRGYAINDVGIAYSSNEINFSTQATLPIVSVYDVSDTDADSRSAVFRGSIDNEGTPAYYERGFVFCTDKSTPTINDTYIKVSGNGKGTYEIKVNGLELDKTYYVRSCAMNEGGMAYSSSSVSFKISTALPVIETLEPSGINRNNGSSTLHGKIISSGSPSYKEKGFVYSTTYTEPTISDNKWIVKGNGAGEFEYRATGLTNKTYYVRAYATNELGTVYGKTVKALGPDYFILSSARLYVQMADIGSGTRAIVSGMCSNSTVDDVNGWRLPSIEELKVLYSNKDVIGGFSSGIYWSSSVEDLHWMPNGGYVYWYYGVKFSDGALYWGAEDANTWRGRCVKKY